LSVRKYEYDTHIIGVLDVITACMESTNIASVTGYAVGPISDA